jgi:hypothetical protein
VTDTIIEPLVLRADNLLWKGGFEDGDILFDWHWDAIDAPWPYLASEHDTLALLVTTHLIPALAAAGHNVEVYRIETIHNPIRASVVDGLMPQDANRNTELMHALRSVSVSLTLGQVAIAAQLYPTLSRLTDENTQLFPPINQEPTP